VGGHHEPGDYGPFGYFSPGTLQDTPASAQWAKLLMPSY
jgi:hypothetical protein